MSSEDIDKGARWSSDIAAELEDSDFGMLCITEDNFKEPWLNFEAGALSKRLDKARVCPFLFNIKPSDLKGPLVQFQAVNKDKDDILKMIASLNEALSDKKLNDAILKDSFEVWWPRLLKDLNNLEKEINKTKKESTTEEKASKDSGTEIDMRSSEMLEELLDLTRTQMRIISNPEKLIPLDYYEFLNSNIGKGKFTEFYFERLRAPLEHAIKNNRDTLNILSSLATESKLIDLELKETIIQNARDTKSALNYIKNKLTNIEI